MPISSIAVVSEGLKGFLRQSSLAWAGVHLLQRLGWIRHRGFHGDRMFQEMILTAIENFHISAFVETGTFLGDTIAFVASRKKAFPVFSCELDESFHARAAARLRFFGNVSLASANSAIWLKELVRSGRLGERPLFFLDAHWYDCWPLKEEVETITGSIREAVMVIDDFQVPGRPEFKFEVGGGGSPEYSGRTTVGTEACNFDYIKEAMNPSNGYRIFYPAYSLDEAYPDGESSVLRGHVVILQNIRGEPGNWAEGAAYREEAMGSPTRPRP